MLIGGMAAIEHGRSRVTEDVDITLGIGPNRFSHVARVARQLRLTPSDTGGDPEAFAQQSMLFPCEASSGVRVDFVFSTLEYERQAIERALVRRLGGYDVRVATVEDVIVMKMVAGRPRDVEDVQALYLGAIDLDIAYIRKWLGSFREMLADVVDQRFEQLIATTDDKREA
jgi:hypothetical protein